jgi:DNA-binding NarL/FixJ family response regulator
MDTAVRQSNIKVQIIDPQEIALWGMKQLISTADNIEVCGSATTAKEALDIAIRHKPDVIILEPNLDDGDGMKLITLLLQNTNAKIIIFTGSNNPNIHDQAIVLGARGIITKIEPLDTLLKAIEKIHAGELWLNRTATSRILMQIAVLNAPKVISNDEKRLLSLSTKQEMVTRTMQANADKSLKEIAAVLNLSEHTLRNHLASIYDKLDLKNRLELYVFCGKYLKTINPLEHPSRRSTDL